MLIGLVCLFLAVLGNAGEVRFQFLFWTAYFRLYEVMIGSALFGIIMTLIYIGHWKYVRRAKERGQSDWP